MRDDSDELEERKGKAGRGGEGSLLALMYVGIGTIEISFLFKNSTLAILFAQRR